MLKRVIREGFHPREEVVLGYAYRKEEENEGGGDQVGSEPDKTNCEIMLVARYYSFEQGKQGEATAKRLVVEKRGEGRTGG